MIKKKFNFKRIAIIHNLNPGGAKRILFEMLEFLPKYFDVSIHEFQSSESDTFDLKEKDVKMYYYPDPKISDSIFFKLPILGLILKYLLLKKSFRSVALKINSLNYDYVIVNHCKHFQSLLLMNMLDYPPIYYCHEPPRAAYEPKIERSYFRSYPILNFLRYLNLKLLKYIDKKSVKNIKNIITSSYYAAESIYRVYGKKAHVLHPGINLIQFKPKVSKEKNYLVSVGSLNPMKNHDFVIRSIGLINEKIKPTLFIICPKTTNNQIEESYLSKMAEENKVKIKILCNLTDDELVTFYSGAIATIFCPHLEPFGLVSLESMACGTPVIGVNEAGLRESISNDKTGFLLPWDEGLFAEKISYLISNPSKHKEMRSNCLSYINNDYWGWHFFVQRLSKLLDKK